jgi:acyl dehydratase
LAGDRNPLHIDPGMGSLAGFDKPILHGLCTYGISAKQVVQNFAAGDHTQLKNIRCRFTSHVFPGETLLFSFWVNGNVVTYSAKTKERGKVVIIGDALLNGQAKL